MVIYKAEKDPPYLANYHPISLLSKTLEKIILALHRNEMAKIAHIPEEQFGFMASFATNYQLLRRRETT